jgi:hypothetical protein
MPDRNHQALSSWLTAQTWLPKALSSAEAQLDGIYHVSQCFEDFALKKPEEARHARPQTIKLTAHC